MFDWLSIIYRYLARNCKQVELVNALNYVFRQTYYQSGPGRQPTGTDATIITRKHTLYSRPQQERTLYSDGRI